MLRRKSVTHCQWGKKSTLLEIPTVCFIYSLFICTIVQSNEDKTFFQREEDPDILKSIRSIISNNCHYFRNDVVEYTVKIVGFVFI